MNIIFSDHADIRCKQQNISPHSIRRQLKDIPKFEKELRWVVREAVLHIARTKKGEIIVVTVIAKRKFSGYVKTKYNKGVLLKGIS